MNLYLTTSILSGVLVLLNQVSAECENGATFTHPSSCGSYLVCVHGVLHELKCPGRLWFNSKLRACDFPEHVVCSVEDNRTTAGTTTMTPRTTTAPPTTTTARTTTAPPTTTTVRTTMAPPTTTTPRTTTTLRPTTTLRTTVRPATTTICQSQPALGTLYRLFRRSTNNHFYTYSLPEADKAVNTAGYVLEGPAGSVAKSANDCLCGASLQPVYRLYRPLKNGVNDDHFYTRSLQEANNAVTKLGYNMEGIAFYCADRQNYCGATLPLYRYYRGVEHFYTTSAKEGSTIVGLYEGILCYIW